ncbi:MAG: ribonuclease HII [Candidatus Micrarchaeaceae archaeon]
MDKIIIAGGDEAGRGAVLGPLVTGVISIKASSAQRLSEIGVRDSKMLSRKRREYLYDEIYAIAEEVKVSLISAAEISRAMVSGISINELEAAHFAKIIDSLKSPVSTIFIDSPEVIQERFGIRISMISHKPMEINRQRRSRKDSIKLISEHKADVKYPVVSGASIIAKVVRDREIDKLKSKLKIDIGSGYPSDMRTIDAIRSNLSNAALAQHIRTKWRTLELIKQMKIVDFLT